MTKYVKHKDLPKAPLLKISFGRHWFRVSKIQRGRLFKKMRHANCVSIFVGPVHIIARRPYLAGPARQLHPHLFRDSLSA